MSTAMKEMVSEMLKGIERYNPHNLVKLEEYIGAQMRDNFNDLEANLAVLKLYQLDPTQFKPHVCAEILIKALSNMPHTDFVLAKCLIDPSNLELEPVKNLCIVHHFLETCQFVDFWAFTAENPEIFTGATGFYDAIRNYICYVIKITYQIIEKPVLRSLLNVDDTELQQFMAKNGWKEGPKGLVFITNQEEIIKTKNITETLSIEGDVAKVLATYR